MIKQIAIKKSPNGEIITIPPIYYMFYSYNKVGN